MGNDLATLSLAALGLGVLHTILGPDHYVPFVALSRARGWSRSRTLGITLICGAGHVAASLCLATVAVGGGWVLTDLLGFESVRGTLAGWLLVGFGLAYLVWGLKQASRDRPHRHWHTHTDGTLHRHGHDHHGSHAHVHESGGLGATPWLLFLIFVFGPCEALIPLVVYPAAQGRWVDLVAVVLTFTLATLATMSAVVLVGWGSAQRIERLLPVVVVRYGHAWAGAALVLCGVLVHLGL